MNNTVEFNLQQIIRKTFIAKFTDEELAEFRELEEQGQYERMLSMLLPKKEEPLAQFQDDEVLCGAWDWDLISINGKNENLT